MHCISFQYNIYIHLYLMYLSLSLSLRHVHRHVHIWMYAYDYTHSSVYSLCTGERGGPGSVTVMTGRCGDSVDCGSMWSASCQFRGNLRSLFKVPTPLRWKFLRFPNVTQCTVQLTTHACWLLSRHIHTIHTHTHTVYLGLWGVFCHCRFAVGLQNAVV